MQYLGVDPGEATGVAIFEDAQLISMAEYNKLEFFEWLNDQRGFQLIVLEDYIIRPPQAGGFNHSWGKVPTIRVIGGVEFYAHTHGIPVEYQTSQILTPAASRFNMPHPQNRSLPMRNAVAATLHGKWWWERIGKESSQCQ